MANHTHPSKKPTKKITAASIVAAVLYVVFAKFVSEDKEVEQAINAFVPLVIAYFVKNDPTPGGYPR